MQLQQEALQERARQTLTKELAFEERARSMERARCRALSQRQKLEDERTKARGEQVQRISDCRRNIQRQVEVYFAAAMDEAKRQESEKDYNVQAFKDHIDE